MSVYATMSKFLRVGPVCRLNRSTLSYCATFSSSSSNEDNMSTTTKSQQSKRRTRRRQLPNADSDSVPSLADFMHRAKVRQQYRNFIRLAQFVDGNNTSSSTAGNDDKPATGECRAALEEVRLSYQLGIKKGTDNLSKTMAFQDGERRLRQLEAMVGYSRKSTTSNGNEEQSSAEESYEADSWINIKDDEDKRGRVGVMWPWESDNESK
mmetsp:Transcript_29105/g.41632  ORF Transcript_29105/g.41632 Transcript_29105/m.41632 type:complete len:209 (-) Transcript_29105:78-704(-)